MWERFNLYLIWYRQVNKWNVSDGHDTMLKLKVVFAQPSQVREKGHWILIKLIPTHTHSHIMFNPIQSPSCKSSETWKMSTLKIRKRMGKTFQNEITSEIDWNSFFSFLSSSESFHKHPMEIDLTQACVGELNTTIRGDINWPIIYGIGVNTRTGEIFPATFPDKGPDIHLRFVCWLHSMFSFTVAN